MSKVHNPIVPNKLVSFRELLENEYLGGWDLRDPKTGQFRDYTVTIASVELFRPKQRKRGERVRRFVIKFVEAEKPWLAGPASGEILKGLYGAPSNWPGKKIAIYFDQNVTFGREQVGGIRPRGSVPSGAPVEELVSQPVDAEIRDKQNAAVEAVRKPG